jgi:trehalose/maltose hydrolase-like predicted phosphorylase
MRNNNDRAQQVNIEKHLNQMDQDYSESDPRNRGYITHVPRQPPQHREEKSEKSQGKKDEKVSKERNDQFLKEIYNIQKLQDNDDFHLDKRLSVDWSGPNQS